jgi:PAS domain S-box-containing protein
MEQPLTMAIADPIWLDAQQALLAAIVNSSEDAIVSKDLDGTVTSWNAAAERIYGWRADEIIGKSKALVIPEDLPNELAAILESVRAGIPIDHYETRRVRKDGTVIDVAISVSPVKSSKGQIIGAATIVRDISERRRTERQLQSKQAEVEALNDRLRRAMRETHHRVKNNLQLISAMIEMQLIEYRNSNSIPLEAYKQLKTHIHTLAIVHDLLSADIREDEDAQRVSVKEVLDQLLPMLQKTAWNKEVRYSIQEAELTSKTCISLTLILNELVTNAVKHGNSQAEVVFRVDGVDATLEVLDDGPGFPGDFDPVKRANMGLELVESLVRADLKGQSAYANSAEGGGRVVINFLLPPDEESALSNGA